MKTRADFVSNSSSCSFVIRDVKSALAAIKSLGTDGFVPRDIDDLILRIYAKRRVIRDLIIMLDKPGRDDFSWRPDDDDCYDVSLCEFASIPDNLLQDSFLQKIDCIYLTCEDYEQEKFLYISVLYAFLKNEKVDVDASDSERPLMFQCNDDSFLSQLMRRAFKINDGEER